MVTYETVDRDQEEKLEVARRGNGKREGFLADLTAALIAAAKRGRAVKVSGLGPNQQSTMRTYVYQIAARYAATGHAKKLVDGAYLVWLDGIQNVEEGRP